MDHIPLPIDSLAHPPLQVPFLASKRWTYDDQGFLTFPDRVGVDPSQLLANDCSLLLLEELAPFLQEWLWFGLLGETIGTGSRVHIPQRIASRSAFIAKREDGTDIITTADLQQCILLASAKNQAPVFDDSHLMRYELCVERALEMVNSILTRWPYNPNSTLSTVYLILLSVQILCETLLASREILFPGCRLQLTPPSNVTHIADTLLLKAGWCWSEIHELPKQVVLRYYLSFMSRSPNWRDHSTCSEERCILRPVVPDHAIRPVHTSDNCLCEETTISEDTIIKHTEPGQVPLLIFSSKSGGKRQLTASKYSLLMAPNFIAISHVRHLGLGSSTSNALPYCQLSLLQTLAMSDDHIMPFWIDTMCVPLPKKAREAALLNVRGIYTAATAVIVLDPCLYRHAVGSATDALLRIKHSSWAKRLWTIQEGVLARKLCFRFLNGVRSLDDMLCEHEKDQARDILHLLPRKREDERTPGGSDEQAEKLAKMLVQLDNDVKTAESLFGHVAKAERPFDRLKLRTALRWGYLASPKFYWMVDEGETWRLRAVIKVLEQAYGGGDVGGDVVDRTTSAADALLERLRVISTVDLKLKMAWREFE